MYDPCRVRIDRADSPPLFIGNANIGGRLVFDPNLARRFHSPLNADEFVTVWRINLQELGVDANVRSEPYPEARFNTVDELFEDLHSEDESDA